MPIAAFMPSDNANSQSTLPKKSLKMLVVTKCLIGWRGIESAHYIA